MDVPKVAPRQAVDQLQQILDSPEVARLVKTLEYVRWTGRPGYPVRAMVGMCLVKSLYALPTWSGTVRLAAEHPGIRAVLGCAPSQWACYRFARQLRQRDDWALAQCLQDVIAGLRERFPNLGRDIAIDGSDLPAYANGHKPEDGEDHKPSDPDASWGHRSAVSTRAKGGFYGYKIHAAVDISTDLPLAWRIASANETEAHHAIPLIDRLKAQGFQPQTAIMDKGYDGGPVHTWCMNRGVAPIIPLEETASVKRGAGEPPHCVHGEWTFAGTDYKQATKWRCPTGECKAKSMWRKASRLHPLIPRETKRYKDLYRQRGAIERQFGRLKHEWALLPLRVRGIGRVQLHADLTMLACLATRLASERVCLHLAA